MARETIECDHVCTLPGDHHFVVIGDDRRVELCWQCYEVLVAGVIRDLLSTAATSAVRANSYLFKKAFQEGR